MLEKFITLMFIGKTEKDDKGATATEYGLLVALIAIALLIGVGFFGQALNQFFQDLGGTVGAW